MAGDEQVAGDDEVLAADAVQSLEDVAVVGDGQLVELRCRDEPGVGYGRVLLALGTVLAEEAVGVERASRVLRAHFGVFYESAERSLMSPETDA